MVGILESKIIYVASPYSHPDDEVRENNFKLVAKLVADLTADGYVCMSPIVYGHTLLNFKEMPSDWEFWKNFCLTFLEKCSEMIVYKMPGWDKSRGVKEEIEFAEKNNIKVLYREYENTI
jgi:hypothetical protein